MLKIDVKFNVVLMDEASQCSEPALLIPLVRSRDIKQLVLLGDHYQLPPTSIKGNDAVLTISPFQRLAGTPKYSHYQIWHILTRPRAQQSRDSAR
jgi:superfamily I DNA and/or RNA helicase